MEKAVLCLQYAPLFSDLFTPFGSLLPSSHSLSLSLTCPMALVVSLLTHCSSAHIHIKTHIHLVEKEMEEEEEEEEITFKVCWRRISPV